MIDFEKFLKDRFTNSRGVIRFLESCDMAPPNYATVEKWFQRKQIPCDWFATLLLCLELERGKPIHLCTYAENQRCAL